jgi:predicted O-methyltransferase YrrM
MNLYEALTKVGKQLDLSPRQLCEFANLDEVPGSDGKDGRLIPFAADGKFLYALIRALRPINVLESGTNEGGSAVHIAMALRDNALRTPVKLVTVDIRADSGYYVFAPLRPLVEVVHQDIKDFVQRSDVGPFDFIHEDASHLADTVFAVYKNLPKLLKPGGVIVSHDTATGVYEHIKSGIEAAGFEMPPCYQFDGSPCGFSVMRYDP